MNKTSIGKKTIYIEGFVRKTRIGLMDEVFQIIKKRQPIAPSDITRIIKRSFRQTEYYIHDLKALDKIEQVKCEHCHVGILLRVRKKEK